MRVFNWATYEDFDFIDKSDKETNDFVYILEFFQWKETEEPNDRNCALKFFYNYEGIFPNERSRFRFHISFFEPNTHALNVGFGLGIHSFDFILFTYSSRYGV